MKKVRFPLVLDGNVIVYPEKRELFRRAFVFDGYVYAYYVGDKLPKGAEEVDVFPEVEDKNIVMEISFIDASGNKKSIAKKGESIFIHLKITGESKEVLKGQNKEFIVPYFSSIDGRQKGAVLVAVKDGEGKAEISFPISGVFEVRSDFILDAETMKKIPYATKKAKVTIAVVEG